MPRCWGGPGPTLLRSPSRTNNKRTPPRQRRASGREPGRAKLPLFDRWFRCSNVSLSDYRRPHMNRGSSRTARTMQDNFYTKE